jgi:hypothetical protein
VGEILDFIKLVDKDGDNKLSIGEYEDPLTQIYKDKYKELEEAQAFNDKDQDRSGKLDQYELMFMYPDIDPNTVVDLLRQLDTDGDYKIDSREFKEKDIEAKFEKANQEAARNKATSGGAGFSGGFNYGINEEPTEDTTKPVQDTSEFDKFDTDASKSLTFYEIKAKHPTLSVQDYENFMSQVDKNNDFELSLEEFMDPKAQNIYKEWMASQMGPGQSTDKGSDNADSEVT